MSMLALVELHYVNAFMYVVSSLEISPNICKSYVLNLFSWSVSLVFMLGLSQNLKLMALLLLRHVAPSSMLMWRKL